MVSAGFTKSNLRLFKTFLRPLRMKFKTYITTSKHTHKKRKMQNHKITGKVNLFKLNSTEDRLDALLNYRKYIYIYLGVSLQMCVCVFATLISALLPWPESPPQCS